MNWEAIAFYYIAIGLIVWTAFFVFERYPVEAVQEDKIIPVAVGITAGIILTALAWPLQLVHRAVYEVKK